MLKKKSFYIITLLIGVGLLAAALCFRMFPAFPKSIGGMCIGVGIGLFGMSVSKLYAKHLEKTDPEIMKQSEIEYADERNIAIRNQAKAKAGDIIQWFIMGIAYATILMGTSLWITLTVVGVFLLKYLLELYFTGKYQKTM